MGSSNNWMCPTTSRLFLLLGFASELSWKYHTFVCIQMIPTCHPSTCSYSGDLFPLFFFISVTSRPVSAANWKNDLQCRRGPNALQNILKTTSRSYQRKTTNKPSLNLQSTTLHGHLMDHVIVGFVAIIIIKFFVTHWANDSLQLVFQTSSAI